MTAAAGTMSCYDFGRALLKTGDLDPVYMALHEAALPRPLLERWLLAYFCFYHSGTASWAAEGSTMTADPEAGYWVRMEQAAGSKDWPRCHERRHFRGETALKSVAYLKGRGTEALWRDLTGPLAPAPRTAKAVIASVTQWYGFGPWIGFKVADMLERLGLVEVRFDLETAMYEGSPTEGAKLLWDLEGQPHAGSGDAAGAWAVGRVLAELGAKALRPVRGEDRLTAHDRAEVKAFQGRLAGYAPPRYERPINVQEAETILCKWKSYMGGHYRLGEDVEGLRQGLLRFARCRLAQRLLRAGKGAGLWS